MFYQHLLFEQMHEKHACERELEHPHYAQHPTMIIINTITNPPTTAGHEFVAMRHGDALQSRVDRWLTLCPVMHPPMAVVAIKTFDTSRSPVRKSISFRLLLRRL